MAAKQGEMAAKQGEMAAKQGEMALIHAGNPPPHVEHKSHEQSL